MYHDIQSFDNFINDAMRDFNRLSIGFEPTLRRLMVNQNKSNSSGYPPFNLEKVDENHYRITLAVAGFAMDELDVTVADNQLTITGIQKNDEAKTYLHKGIAERDFTRSFVLADHVNVASARLDNGLLVLDLIQEIPDVLKPRKIAIANGTAVEADVIETKINVA